MRWRYDDLFRLRYAFKEYNYRSSELYFIEDRRINFYSIRYPNIEDKL